MATFPSLKPSGRTFTPGEYPHTSFNAYNGFQNRVRHSNVMLTSSVKLSFIALTESQMLSILAHYQGQFGTYESFDLPADAWSGVTSASDYQLAGYLWRYIEPPVVDDIHCEQYNVELTLETVPPDGAEVDGMWRVVNLSILGVGAFSANGLSKSVTIGFAPAGFEMPGLTGSVTISLAAGTGAASSGFQITTTASLLDGTAASSGGSALSVVSSLAAGSATGDVATSDYWADMSAQLYGWESLAYIEWWGN